MIPTKTIVLVQIGVMSFAGSLALDIMGEKGSYKYSLIWTANALTVEWGGVWWASKNQ